MSPLIETFGNVTIRAFGLTRGGGEKYFIATGKTGATTYGASVAGDTAGNIYWSFLDQSNNVTWTTLTSGATVGSSFYTSGSTYTAYNGRVAVDSTGNIYVASVDSTAGTYSSQLLKVNSAGVKQWSRKTSFQGSNAYNFSIDSSGNIYGAAVSNQPPFAGNTQCGVVKYNSAGTLQWGNYYIGQSPNGAYSNAAGYSAIVNSAGTAVYVCCAITNSAGNMSPTIMKLNTSGVVQWTTDAANWGGNAPASALDSSDNSYIVYGSSAETRLAQITSSGGWAWGNSFSGSGPLHNSVAVDSAGNSYILSYDQNQTIYIAKYNSSGTIQWQRSILCSSGTLYLHESSATNQTSGFYVTATSMIFTASNYANKAVLFKLPIDGSLTGTYVVDGATYVYAASSQTNTSITNNFLSITTGVQSTVTDSAGANVSASATPTYVTKVIP